MYGILYSFSIFVHDVSLIAGIFYFNWFNILIMVNLGMLSLLYAVLSMSMFNNLAYLLLILWSTAKG